MPSSKWHGSDNFFSLAVVTNPTIGGKCVETFSNYSDCRIGSQDLATVKKMALTHFRNSYIISISEWCHEWDLFK